MARIGLIHRDGAERDAIVHALTGAGHSCWRIDDRTAAGRILDRETLDLILAEWNDGSPGLDALAWVRGAPDARVPVLGVAAAASDEEIARALETGADDFICGANPTILRARVHAALRRLSASDLTDEWRIGPYVVSRLRRTVAVDGRPVGLTRREYALAELLFANPGRKLSRAYVMEAVWGRQPSITGRTLDTHVSRLRAKLKLDGAGGLRLTSLYGYGYQLEHLGPAAS